jgi:hypothetical protein
MLHPMRRRSAHDPLKPTDVVTWLVVRNVHRDVLDSTRLCPGADLAAALSAERNARIAAGWTAEPIPAHCAFFFCARDDERVLVAIEMRCPLAALQ